MGKFNIGKYFKINGCAASSLPFYLSSFEASPLHISGCCVNSVHPLFVESDAYLSGIEQSQSRVSRILTMERLFILYMLFYRS